MGAWLSKLLRQARSSSGISTAGRSSSQKTSHSMAQCEEQFWLVMRDRTQLHAFKHQKYVEGQLAGWLTPSLLTAEASQPSHTPLPIMYSPLHQVLLVSAGNEPKLAVIVLHPHGWLGGSSSDHVVMELFRSFCVCFLELGSHRPLALLCPAPNQLACTTAQDQAKGDASR